MLKSDPITEIESASKSRKRLFEAGEMKLLVLHFISQQPKYSYDIIKDVSALVGGNYKPSTGTICPTINYLEEQEYTQVIMSADQRKQYHITQKGFIHLEQYQEDVEKILYRFNTRNQIHNNSEYLEIKRAMENLKASLRLKILHAELSTKQVEIIADKIDQAAVEIARL